MVKIKFIKQESEHVFFTSDTHFYHKNILHYCNRPFKDIQEMNQTLIDNWNSVVEEDDYVFHLGDFCFAGSDKWKELTSQLNGHIVLIKGNHDHMSKTMEKLFDHVSYEMSIEVDKTRVYLNHYPFLTYAGPYKKAPVIQLFGHVHTSKRTTGKDRGRIKMLFPTQYDVGVDNNNFTPVSWKQISKRVTEQCKKRNSLKNRIINWIINRMWTWMN